MNSLKGTPTFKSRKETECSESLLPQLDLNQQNSVLGSIQNHQEEEQVVVAPNQTIQPAGWSTNFFIGWFVIWLCIAIFQVYIYIRLIHTMKIVERTVDKIDITIVKIDNTINIIDEFRDELLKLKQLLCEILPIPELCPPHPTPSPLPSP